MNELRRKIIDGTYRLRGVPESEVKKTVNKLIELKNKVLRIEGRDSFKKLDIRKISPSFSYAINEFKDDEEPERARATIIDKRKDIEELLSLPKYKGNKDLLDAKSVIDNALKVILGFSGLNKLGV